MAGTSRLLFCEGFIESEGFERSKEDLKALSGLTDEQIDDRLEALLWEIRRDTSTNMRRIRDSLWVAVIPRGIPPLRIYLCPRPGARAECELLWIEERV
jgi:hypothetical protein